MIHILFLHLNHSAQLNSVGHWLDGRNVQLWTSMVSYAMLQIGKKTNEEEVNYVIFVPICSLKTF